MSGLSRNVSLLVLSGLILTFALAFYQLLQPFLLPLFLASILTIVVRPVYDYLLRKLWNRPNLAGLATTLLILAIVFVPMLGGLFVGSVQLYDWSEQLIAQSEAPRADDLKNPVNQDPQKQPVARKFIPPAVEQRIDQAVDRVNEFIAPSKIDKEKFRVQLWQGVQKYIEAVLRNTPGMLGSAVAFLVSFAIMMLALYFFLVDGSSFVDAAERLFPLQAEYQRIVRKRFVVVTRAVVLGTFLAAVAQGVATGIALRVAGFPQFVLLTVLATLAAIIPFVGTALIWVPCAAWLALTDWNANAVTVIVLVLYQLIFVGFLDNVIRAYILNSDVKLHPLLALLSVLGGLQWLGLWGVFIGPLIASCLHALMEILRQEIQRATAEQEATPEPPAA